MVLELTPDELLSTTRSVRRRLDFDLYTDMGQPTYAEGDARGERQAAVRTSAQFLRIHMHEAPVLVIPLSEGRIDGADAFGQASYWGSIRRRRGA